MQYKYLHKGTFLGGRMLQLHIWLENYGRIARGFGMRVALEVERQLTQRAVEIDTVRRAVSLGGGCIGIVCCEDDGPESRRHYVGRLLMNLSRAAVSDAGESVRPVLSAMWKSGDDRYCLDGSFLSAGAGKSYLSAIDLDAVAMVERAIAAERVMLVFQPICSVFDRANVLYRECLCRVVLDDGRIVYPSMFVPNLERAGLARLVDHYVIRRVLSELKRHSELTLGVNISAQSMVEDEWWRGLVSELEQAPTVARKLIIEITETDRLRSTSARELAQRLRNAGCRIAIDDFGAGFSNETSVALGKFDIAKIDRSILTGCDSEAVLLNLSKLRELVVDRTSEIVVEGVETERELQLIRRAGFAWAQGHYLRKPQKLQMALL